MAKIVLEIKTDGKITRQEVYSGPAGWKEFTAEHFILWASAMCSGLQSLDAKSILAAMLYKMPRKVFFKVLDKKERVRLSFAIDFLFKKNGLQQWLLPSIVYRLKKYYGPKSRLSNITAEEFTLCEHCYEQFDITKKIDYLEMLAAILYRPRRWFNIDNDLRQALTINSTEARALKFKKLPDRLKWSIYLNYEGCRNFIIDNNPEIFKKGDGSPGPKSLTPWSKIVQNGAGGIFGTLQETEKSNAHKFLSELNTRMKEKKAADQNSNNHG